MSDKSMNSLPYERFQSRPGIGPQRLARAKINLKTSKEFGDKPVKFERKITPEERRFINLAKNFLSQQIEELGVKGKIKIESDRVHFYDWHWLTPGASGMYDSTTNAVYVEGEEERPDIINKFSRQLKIPEVQAERRTKWSILEDTLHELIHYLHFRSISVAKQVNVATDFHPKGYKGRSHSGAGLHGFRGKLEVSVSRLGYAMGEKLVTFNETLMEKMELEMLGKHWSELRSKFDFVPEEIPRNLRQSQIDTLSLIAKSLAKKSGERESDIWREWYRGQFTGEMMHLRKLEKYFGPGTLEFLAAWDSEDMRRSENSMTRDTFRKLFRSYFLADKQEDRDRVAGILLKKDARSRYAKMRLRSTAE